MAVIGSIRKRSGLLIILIGMAILLFVLGDALGSGGLFSGSIPSVGTINGEQVDINELEAEAARIEQLYATYNSNITRDQARKQAWGNMVRDRVFYKSVKSAGIQVTEDEFDDIRWGDGVLDEISKEARFNGPNGRLSPDSVQQYYALVYKNRPEIYVQEKKRLIESQLTNKFNTLVGKSVYYNKIDGMDNAKGSTHKVSFQFAGKNFNSIPDSTITVDEDRLRTYFNEHKNDKSLEQVESRNIDFVAFKVEATEADINAIRENMMSLKDEFRNGTNDSTFVLINSDIAAFRKTPYISGTRRDKFDELIANGNVGDVIGPFKEGDTFKISKIVGKTEPVEEARVRHILIKSAVDNDLLKGRSDSILAAIKSDVSQFDVLGAKFSEDGFARNQGVYDWFPKGKMVTEFEDFSFNNPEGSIGVVKTQFGYHIIEVLGRRSEVRSIVADLTKNIIPSTETVDAVYNEASKFAVDHSTEDKFIAGAKENNLKIVSVPNLGMSAQGVGTISKAREVVKWAFEDERVQGEVSNLFDLGDDTNFIIAKYISKKEKGMPTFESAKDAIKIEVIKELKADQIIASISGAGDLNAIATTLGTDVKNAENISFNASSAAGVQDAVLVGKAFSLGEGEVSEPIRGSNGVYVIKVLSKNLSGTEGGDFTVNQNNLMKQVEKSIIGKIQAAMNKEAGVENVIDKFY